MPKMKSHSSAKKRFKITGGKKVKRRKEGMRHLLSKKSASKKRNLKRSTLVSDIRKRKILRMLST